MRLGLLMSSVGETVATKALVQKHMVLMSMIVLTMAAVVTMAKMMSVMTVMALMVVLVVAMAVVFAVPCRGHNFLPPRLVFCCLLSLPHDVYDIFSVM